MIKRIAPTAADIDGDGDQEVVVGNALYRVDGSAIWSNGLTDGYPAVADFNGHPDYQMLISRLEDAVVRQTMAGGDQVGLA